MSVSKGIYAIRDSKAETIIGGVHLFAHQAAAVRFFGDIASDSQTMVARHINDHELLYLGQIAEETGVIVSVVPELVISGAAWKAAQNPEENS